MRNIKNYVVAAFALFLLDGCDFLDYDETSGKTKEEAYSYFNNMNSSVAYIYGFLPTDFGRVSDAMMDLLPITLFILGKIIVSII